MRQLFNKVEATKYSSKYFTTAEFFVACNGYINPSSINSNY